jgi:hypothetical protein
LLNDAIGQSLCIENERLCAQTVVPLHIRIFRRAPGVKLVKVAVYAVLQERVTLATDLIAALFAKLALNVDVHVP